MTQYINLCIPTLACQIYPPPTLQGDNTEIEGNTHLFNIYILVQIWTGPDPQLQLPSHSVDGTIGWMNELCKYGFSADWQTHHSSQMDPDNMVCMLNWLRQVSCSSSPTTH